MEICFFFRTFKVTVPSFHVAVFQGINTFTPQIAGGCLTIMSYTTTLTKVEAGNFYQLDYGKHCLT